MARGFNTTFGVNTSDIITTTFAVDQGTAAWSYSFWFFITSGLVNNNQRIWQQDNTSVNNRSVYFANNGTFSCMVFQYAWTGAVAAWNITNNIANYTTGVWHHMLITYDAGSTANVPIAYMDGVSIAISLATAPSGTVLADTDPWTIGNRAAGARCWDGKIADLAVWNTTLNAGEAAALARGVRPSRIRQSRLLWLQLDGLQSPEPDLSGGAFNGTLTGTALTSGPPVAMFTPRWPQFLGPVVAPPLPPPTTNLLFV